MKVLRTTDYIDYELKLGEHILHFYDNKNQQIDVLSEFLKDGFNKEHKCIAIVDKEIAYDVQDRYVKDNIDASYYQIHGQLTFITHEEFYIRNSRFDDKKLIGIVSEAVSAALSQGWKAVRIANELTKVISNESDLDAWLRFEASVNNYLSHAPMIMLCQYNQRYVPGEIVINLIKTHPYVILSDEIFQNPYFINPEKFLKSYQGNNKFYA